MMHANNQENLHPNILASHPGRFDPLLSTTSYQTMNGASLQEEDLKPRSYPFGGPPSQQPLPSTMSGPYTHKVMTYYPNNEDSISLRSNIAVVPPTYIQQSQRGGGMYYS